MQERSQPELCIANISLDLSVWAAGLGFLAQVRGPGPAAAPLVQTGLLTADPLGMIYDTTLQTRSDGSGVGSARDSHQ